MGDALEKPVARFDADIALMLDDAAELLTYFDRKVGTTIDIEGIVVD